MVSEYKSRMEPGIRAFKYNPACISAISWVHYYLARPVYGKKKKVYTVIMTILTYGPDNQSNENLKRAIKENRKSGGTMDDDFDGYYDEYVHESGTCFHICNIRETNYIKVYNTIKLDK